MKIITRITMLYIIIGHLIVFMIAPYSTKGLEALHATDWLILSWGGLYILSIFCMWGYLFHHWGIAEFKSVKIKRTWFWVILLGGILYFIGPLLYYIIVCEMAIGLRRKY